MYIWWPRWPNPPFAFIISIKHLSLVSRALTEIDFSNSKSGSPLNTGVNNECRVGKRPLAYSVSRLFKYASSCIFDDANSQLVWIINERRGKTSISAGAAISWWRLLPWRENIAGYKLSNKYTQSEGPVVWARGVEGDKNIFTPSFQSAELIGGERHLSWVR